MNNKLKSIIMLLFFLLIIFLEFKNVIFNITNSFIDWGDTPFIAWQIFVTRDKLINLKFSELMNTNAHYPFQYSLFFTDTFIGQAVMAIPLFFIKNPILLYNLILLANLFINYFVAYFLFKKILQSQYAGFIGSFFLNNSFYVFDQIIHLQTLCYWPLLFTLYFLSNQYEQHKRKNFFIIGFFTSLQFYFSVYLAIFNIFLVGFFYLIKFFSTLLFDKKNFFGIFKETVIYAFTNGIIFLFLSSPLIVGYTNFEKIYHQIRDINEIIQNSGNLTDYLFFLPNTFFSNLSFIKRYNEFNRFSPEKPYFPGFILTFGFVLGAFFQNIKRIKNEVKISYQVNFKYLLFFS